MAGSRIKYNPSLSVHQNAVNNGVSDDGIRYYIKTHSIDRCFERKVNIVKAIRNVLKKKPNATMTEVARDTLFGRHTVRKYWEIANGRMELERSNIGRKRIPKKTLRELNNFYATHPSCTWDILREERFCTNVLEPFCGVGTMSEVIKRAGYNVESYDIIDRGYGRIGDFFEVSFDKWKTDIISNPPYNENLIEIVIRCIDICKNKVALLLPIRYLSGAERYNELYKIYPPSRVYVYMERICIAKNADFDTYNDAGANKEIYGWFVWEKGFIGTTELKWIHNEKRMPIDMQENTNGHSIVHKQI